MVARTNAANGNGMETTAGVALEQPGLTGDKVQPPPVRIEPPSVVYRYKQPVRARRSAFITAPDSIPHGLERSHRFSKRLFLGKSGLDPF
jgi:hypothetical protein